jgi:hypothetical protein
MKAVARRKLAHLYRRYLQKALQFTIQYWRVTQQASQYVSINAECRNVGLSDDASKTLPETSE